MADDPPGGAALTQAVAQGAIEVAMMQADPDSVSAATRLRAQFAPEVAAAALTQAGLRRRAVTKFGAEAERWFFTPAGLEQATRPAVANFRAQRLVQRGVHRIVDLGCGIGADSVAFGRAGLSVVAVEQDSLTATVARLNLAAFELADVEVRHGDAVALAGGLLSDPTVAAFCDPARRGTRGRTWDVSQFTPPWDFVSSLLAGPACLKLGPGVPGELIPDEVEVCFVSHEGDLVEATMWSPTLTDRPGRVAELLTADGAVHRMVADRRPPIEADRLPQPGDVIVEPDPAVLRAGATDALAEELGAARVADRVGYLLADDYQTTPFGRSYQVLETLRWNPKEIKAWLRGHNIGILEIKKRGLEFDPAQLRRTLLGKKGYGDNAATLIVTPTPEGARTLVVRTLGG